LGRTRNARRRRADSPFAPLRPGVVGWATRAAVASVDPQTGRDCVAEAALALALALALARAAQAHRHRPGMADFLDTVQGRRVAR
jgi:hypothetical protein